jgi:hypothetical protein
MRRLFNLMLAEVVGRILNRRRFNNPFCWVRLRMYRSFACRLVDKKDWYMIKLYSGMQTPLLDAIEYLAAIKDRSSIPRLKDLLTHYLKKPDDGKSRTASWGGGEVSCLYGPMDYVPEYIQTASIRALLSLLEKAEARKFAQELLAQAESNGLCERSIQEVSEFLKLDYIGRGFWRDDSRFKAPFAVPNDSVMLQQGYRGQADGSFIEHFLLCAKKEDYWVRKTDDNSGISWITATLVLGTSEENSYRVKVKYILHEDGSGVIDGTVFDVEDLYGGHYDKLKKLEHLWLRFSEGILPDTRLKPAV